MVTLYLISAANPVPARQIHSTNPLWIHTKTICFLPFAAQKRQSADIRQVMLFYFSAIGYEADHCANKKGRLP
jgi:hypothetical protein